METWTLNTFDPLIRRKCLFFIRYGMGGWESTLIISALGEGSHCRLLFSGKCNFLPEAHELWICLMVLCGTYYNMVLYSWAQYKTIIISTLLSAWAHCCAGVSPCACLRPSLRVLPQNKWIWPYLLNIWNCSMAPSKYLLSWNLIRICKCISLRSG